jgi:glycosyltransferase involved in cell wall biosynthesis
MNNPKISVVIPAYNNEAYLEAAVRSVMSQTMNEIEIILVNDGSTDRTGDIIQSLASEDDRIKVISQQNKGVSVARNSGIAASIAPYIAFLDSDDILEKDALEVSYLLAEKDHLDFVFFDADSFGLSEANQRWFNYRRSAGYKGIYTGAELFNMMLKDKVYRCQVCMNLIRMDYLKKYSLRFYPGIIHEDELFSAKMYLYAKRVEGIPRVLYHRRLRADSIMTTSFSNKNLNGYLTVFSELTKFGNANSFSVQRSIRLLISTILPTMMSNAWALKWNERFNLARIANTNYHYAVKLVPTLKLLFKKPIKHII